MRKTKGDQHIETSTGSSGTELKINRHAVCLSVRMPFCLFVCLSVNLVLDIGCLMGAVSSIRYLVFCILCRVFGFVILGFSVSCLCVCVFLFCC
jgi:hypothetical protein